MTKKYCLLFLALCLLSGGLTLTNAKAQTAAGIVPNQQTPPTYVAVPRGLTVPIATGIDVADAFSVGPPLRADFILFGQQITPVSYPATLRSVLYPSLNGAIRQNNAAAPSAAGARVRVFVFSGDTNTDWSRTPFPSNIQQADFTLTKDFSNPTDVKSYADFNEFDTPDITISRGSFFVLVKLLNIGTSRLRSDGTDFFFNVETQGESSSLVSTNDGRSLEGVGVEFDDGTPVDFPIVGRVALANNAPLPPEIETIKYAQGRLNIIGDNTTFFSQVRVNDRVIPPSITPKYNAVKRRLRFEATPAALNLRNGDNIIVVSNGTISSPRIRFTYTP